MAIDEDKITEMAEAPKSVRTDEGRIEERPVDDLIKANNYNKSVAAADRVPWGLRMARTKPGGTV